MKRTTLIAGLTVLAIGATSGLAFAKGPGGEGRGHGGPRFDFDAIDANGDGKITQAEIDAYRLAKFAEADTDGDGNLSVEELAAQAEARKAEREARRAEMGAERIAKMVEKKDTNGDGMLSADEMGDGDRAAKMFEKLDTDGDGAISKEELEAMKGKRRGGGKAGGN